MGYSVAFRALNKKAFKEMLDFMDENLKSYGKIKGVRGYADGPKSDLSYDHNKLSIGFDYGPMLSEERSWIFAVVRWMAIRAGKKKDFKKIGLKKIPYYVYDGYEYCPIIVFGEKDIREAKLKFPDEDIHSKYGYALGCQALYISTKLKNELKRLDRLWEKRNR